MIKNNSENVQAQQQKHKRETGDDSPLYRKAAQSAPQYANNEAAAVATAHERDSLLAKVGMTLEEALHVSETSSEFKEELNRIVLLTRRAESLKRHG